MDFQSYARPYIKIIEAQLQKELGAFRKDVKSRIPQVLPLIDLFIKANSGGGRLRGVLIFLGYETANGGLGKMSKSEALELARVAAALEIFQTSILAQDDFMDKSELRRGIPALYRAIASWHKKNKMLGDPIHFGASQAVSLADVGFFLAADLIAKTNFPAESRIRALQTFNRLVMYTGLGQVLDINMPFGRKQKTEKDVLAVERHKTAEYTAVGPLLLGAQLHSVSPGTINSLTQFGINLGIAFQIQDDIKGVFGKSEETGKSAKEDIQEGKITLLYVHAFKNLKLTANSSKLKSLYGKPDLTEGEAEEVRRVFRETGALDYAIQMSKKYASRARTQIKKITKNPDLQLIYENLCNFILKER